jgi:2-oxoglutarate dehydrogenase E2 component (dihydrolipoamide succinyltransferase)
MSKSSVELKVPSVGESVTEVEIGEWLKQPGDPVRKDETVVVLETDKATVDIPAPSSGHLSEILHQKGARIQVGDVLGRIDSADADSEPSAPLPSSQPQPQPQPQPAAKKKSGEKQVKPDESKAEPTARDEQRVMPSAARLMKEKGIAPDAVEPSGPGGRILKEDVQRAMEAKSTMAETGAKPEMEPTPESASGDSARGEQVVPMTLLRRKVAERLVQAQQNGALLTTFNEIDMTGVMALRKEYQERFQARYQIKLGFMSFFVKATVDALQETPQLNASIRGSNIVYREYCDIGIAIGGGRGLVVPVLRNAEQLSFADIELSIAEFARKATENKLRPEDLEGGTFTITNGGVYGSLLSTPLINPPQSGVLGMHSIQDRPVAREGQVVIRPMMYVALTYDHRIVDGREAVTCLRRIKDLVEHPVRILIEV